MFNYFIHLTFSCQFSQLKAIHENGKENVKKGTKQITNKEEIMLQFLKKLPWGKSKREDTEKQCANVKRQVLF